MSSILSRAKKTHPLGLLVGGKSDINQQISIDSTTQSIAVALVELESRLLLVMPLAVRSWVTKRAETG